ncbi:MAG: hypothetical protein COB59_08950 [Rhodospirillaceae bacterium]|nr:MAG: hypothetical protein COB59_08950 [Rhodospirillaceae bacterium]
MNIDLRVAQLLVSRVCHDLAGGIGALSTGAELLAEEQGTPDDAALDLIALSAKQTTARLQFLRLAFGLGAGQGGGQFITTAELHQLFANYVEGGRLSLQWNSKNIQIGLHEGRLLLNLCQIARDALPRGGVIEVDISHFEGRLGFGLSARGKNALLIPQFATTICEDVNVDMLTPGNVQAHLTAVLGATLGAELEFASVGGEEVRIAALLPEN